jgi:hypothetical protein
VYYVLYNTATGAILACGTAPLTAGTGEAVLTLPASDTGAIVCSQYPSRYLVQNGALVAQPFIVVAVSGSGPYTVTATVTGAAPATATFAVSGTGSVDAAVTGGTATWTVDLHPALASAQITATVTAAGCVPGVATFGGQQVPPVGIQLYTPTGGNPTVAPVGPGSADYLQAYYASTLPQAHTLGDLGTADSIALDAVLTLLAMATGLTPAQQAALTYLQTNLQPTLPVRLETLVQNGQPVQPVVQYVADQTLAQQAFAAFAKDMAQIPGLQ